MSHLLGCSPIKLKSMEVNAKKVMKALLVVRFPKINVRILSCSSTSFVPFGMISFFLGDGACACVVEHQRYHGDTLWNFSIEMYLPKGASISLNMLKVFFVFVIKRKANGYVMTGEIYPAFAACVTQSLN